MFLDSRSPPHGQHFDNELHEPLAVSSCDEAGRRRGLDLPGTERRFIGPAMPSADILAAATRLTEAEARLRRKLEQENDPFIGPAPPTVVAEVAYANDAERIEEVMRMLSREVENAYDLLGVKSDVEPAALKKKYWKLSLLVHPDKCQHPEAHKAFMALNKAFNDLQDPSKRAEINRKIAEKEAREEFAAEMQTKRDAAQWRLVRGMIEEGDDELLRGPLAAARDEWMTRLPPQREVCVSRGDPSAWTDTPADKALKANMQYLDSLKQAAFTNGPPDKFEERKKERARKEAQFMDSYNSHKRSQSLMEKHNLVERSAGGKKKSKKAEKQAGVGTRGASVKEPDLRANYSWKPWERERFSSGKKTYEVGSQEF